MTNQRLLCCSDGTATIAGLANQVMNINESGTVLRKKMLPAAGGSTERSAGGSVADALKLNAPLHSNQSLN